MVRLAHHERNICNLLGFLIQRSQALAGALLGQDFKEGRLSQASLYVERTPCFGCCSVAIIRPA
ncbi:MAG TPA: hypothetical protein VJA25_02485 [Dehalococcoidia bacterium]|nr:hypothetical protein [Dehalococcoidia bacterium]